MSGEVWIKIASQDCGLEATECVLKRDGLETRLVPRSASAVPDCWALVLAGGDGTRLRHLTTNDAGDLVPKQYCTINRESCLLQDSLRRCIAVAAAERICTVVASQHERWWHKALVNLAPGNIFVQPANRGTAFGVLLGLLKLEQRAGPESAVLLLPADHFVSLESVMAQSLIRITECALADPDGVYLLGAEPEGAEEDLGYIVPWHSAAFLPVNVYSFVEKPDRRQALKLINEGALWNTFILSGSVRSLLRLFEPRFSAEISEFRAALAEATAGNVSEGRLSELYESLRCEDFSKDILERKTDSIRVLRMPACGWSDLGTPSRLEQTARAYRSAPQRTHEYLDLTRQFANSGLRLSN